MTGQGPIRVLRVIARMNVGGPAWQSSVLTRCLGEHGIDTRLIAGQLGSGEASFQIWFLVSLGVAIAGWAFAYSQTQLRHQAVRADERKAWLYVLFWNKFYVDEIYDAYIVNPIIRLAQWFSRSAETREIQQSMEKFSRQTMALGDILALTKSRVIGNNILFLIFGFVFTMGLLYILS